MTPAETFRAWPTDSRYSVGDLGTILGPSGRPVGSPHPQGYTVVTVRLSDGRRTSTTAHVMVCEAFHGPRPAGMQVAHGNGDASDSRAANLRWAPPPDNAADKVEHGTNGRKLTNTDVQAIRAAITQGESRASIALRHRITPGMVSHIRTGHSWSNLDAAS